MEIKICGIRRFEDVEIINRYKPDYIGFILPKGYRRTVSPQLARKLKDALADGIKTVGVFVNENIETVQEYARYIRLDAVQLHGDEDEDYISALDVQCEIWQTLRVHGGMDITDVAGADRILLDKYDPDCYGGTGESYGRDVVGAIRVSVPMILAGGLNKDNVEQRIKLFKPQCVDVSSSVETNGFKDEAKVREFINKVRMI